MSSSISTLPDGIRIEAPQIAGDEQVLTPQALAFVADLARLYAPAIEGALERRRVRRDAIAAGRTLDFLPETAEIRAAAWTVGPLPDDLQRRIVEITGPVDAKMMINA